jgi:predicted nucleotidyltransferase
MLTIVEAARQALQSTREPILSAYLFGSQASASGHTDSDVDVAVLFDRSAVPEAADRGRRALRLAADLIAATHVNRVDVVPLNDAPPELAARVFCDGIRLLCRDDRADRAFVRQTLLLAADQAPFLRRTRRLKLAAIAQ